jgi:hypothetical protein
MSPAQFDEISRVARLAVLSSLFSSLVADDVDANADVQAVVIRGQVVPDGLTLSMSYEGPNGVQLGEVSL